MFLHHIIRSAINAAQVSQDELKHRHKVIMNTTTHYGALLFTKTPRLSWHTISCTSERKCAWNLLMKYVWNAEDSQRNSPYKKLDDLFMWHWDILKRVISMISRKIEIQEKSRTCCKKMSGALHNYQKK